MRGIGHYRKRLGDEGENEAAHYLQKKGYTILETNFRIGHGEIDIVAQDGDTLVFVEVKTKKQDGFGEPEDRVNRKKQIQMGKVAMGYLQENNLDGVDCRFDVITVVYKRGKKVLRHIEDAFWLNSQDLGELFG